MLNQASTNESRHRRRLMLVLLVALGVRLTTACLLQYLLDYRWHRPFLISGDAEGYWMLAQRITAGEDYSIYTPPRYALRMPGFPTLLAIPVFFFGPSLFAARLFLAAVGTFACCQVYWLGKQMFDRRIGLLAAAAAAISPVLVVFTETILSETAFAVTLLWSLSAGHSLFTSLGGIRQPVDQVAPQTGRTLLPIGLNSLHTGLAIAAGVMMRPSWILASVVVALLLMLTTPRKMAAIFAGGLVILTMVFALLPWGIRNQQVTGHFTLTTFWMGPSLYDGLNPQATGDSNMEFYDRDNLMRSMSEYDVDQHYRKAAKEFALQHPARTAALAAAKAVRYWKPWPNADQFSAWWISIPVSLFFIPIFFLALLGGIRLFLNKSRLPIPPEFPVVTTLSSGIWAMAILAGPIFYFAVIHMVFVSSLRYRLPAEYPLLILSAYGLLGHTDFRRQRSP